MPSTLRILIIAGIFSLTAMSARAAAEIVIAIRYLQAEGNSHSHLYLYREDGKLLRQLTNDNSGQDSGPIFAPDGSMIVFTREKPNGAREFWSVDSLGKTLKKLEAAPDWYVAAKSSPSFTNIESDESTSTLPALSPAATPVPAYKSPDGSVELVLRLDPKDEDDQINGPGHGKHYLLHDNQDEDQHFLFEGPLRLAFCDLHLNSTDGDTVFALDLTGQRFVRLSPNWAAPIPLPGEAAFLTFTENRYVPIPGSKKTANCSYMEHWDEKLNKIRYAREKSAALCYGASIYRPELTPSTITMRRSSN